MAKHLVKCAICGETFDRDSIQAVRHGARRYSHATCEPDNTDFVPLVLPKKKAEDPELKELNNYIYKLFGDKTNWALVKKQIKTYTEENKYSISGILKSLVYFYEVQNNNIEKSNYAIGIVPFCYQAARDYYYGLWLAQQRNENKIIITKEKEVVIKEPRKPGLLKKFFRLGEDDE